MIQNAPVASEHAQLYTPDLTVPILGLTLASGGDVGSPRLTSRYASLYLLQLRTAFDQGAEDGTSALQHAYPAMPRRPDGRTDACAHGMRSCGTECLSLQSCTCARKQFLVLVLLRDVGELLYSH